MATPTPTPTPTATSRLRGKIILNHPDSGLIRADSNRRIAFKSGDKWGYLYETGQVAIQATYSSANRCREGLCVVTKMETDGTETTQVIDINGSLQFSIAKSLYPRTLTEVSHGLLGVCNSTTSTSSSCGFLNMNGNIAIGLNYSSVKPFKGNAAPVSLNVETDPCKPNMVMIDDSGSVLTQAERFESIGLAWGNFFLFKPGSDSCLDGNASFIGEKNGTPLTEVLRFLHVSEESSHGYGLVRLSQGPVAPYWFVDAVNVSLQFGQSFAMASSFSEGLAAVKSQEGDYGYINTKGEWVLDGYRSASSFRYGRAIVGVAVNKYKVIDRDGLELGDASCERMQFVAPNLRYFPAGCLPGVEKQALTDDNGQIIMLLDGINLTH